MRRSTSLFTAAVLLLFFTLPLAATETQTVSRTFDLGSGARITLENLAGHVRVVPGETVRLNATIHAGSKSLLDALELRTDVRGSSLSIVAEYPVGRYRDFVYNAGGESGGGWFGGSRSQVEYLGSKVRVFSSPRRGAAELWVDMELQVPSSMDVSVRNRIGRIDARGVSAEKLELDSASGDVTARDGDGTLVLDTGSGDVKVENHQGTVEADTGSGDVEVIDVAGDVKADTGSGDVILRSIDGVKIFADTGSGDVTLDDVRGSLLADTGSGSVSGRDVQIIGQLEVDTGSGGVDLRGDLSGITRALIDTGSGGVVLESTSFPGMDLDISTGSGRIELDLSGLRGEVVEKDRFLGSSDGGGVSVTIDTGSGGVKIHRR